VERRELVSSGSGWGPVEGCFGHDDEPWASQNEGNFLNSWMTVSVSRTLLQCVLCIYLFPWNPLQGKDISSSPPLPNWLCSGYRGRFAPRPKSLECEADLFPPSVGEVKNVCGLSSIFLRSLSQSSVGIALGYGLNARGYRVRFPAGGWEFFFSPPRPERLWGPPSLVSNGYQGLSFPGGKAAEAWSWLLSSI
jgi:hypothetical protein